MDFLQFTAGKDDERRADKVLRLLLPNQHLSAIYSAFRKGFIRVNDKRIKPDKAIHHGDTISIASFLLCSTSNQQDMCAPAVFPYDIILKNDDVLVINKPYNIEVQHELVQVVRQYYNSQKNGGRASLTFAPAPLHRLDKKTTGLLFFSWSIRGAQWFSRAIAEHKIEKQYVALVQGEMTQQHEWNDFIKKNAATDNAAFHTVRVFTSAHENALLAQTKAKPLCTSSSGITLVHFTIATGRTHQIRAQSAQHGYPLLGDTAYGARSTHEEQDIFLHAYKMILPENELGLPRVLRAPLPRPFKKINDKILKNWQEAFIL
ncbi:MAG: RluA family pseudouridine synthase [Treponema sp.]|nr:RluA family pseudouridine synthase [Treponema sp.]